MAFSSDAVDTDVLIVGAGITGIYQLYCAREAGCVSISAYIGSSFE